MACTINCIRSHWVNGEVVRTATATINEPNMARVFTRIASIERYLTNSNAWIGTTVECHILERVGKTKSRTIRHLVTLTKKY